MEITYEYFKPSHAAGSQQVKDDVFALKSLEDKLLDVFKCVMKIAKDDCTPPSVGDRLESLVCMASPWDLDDEQLADIENLHLVEPVEEPAGSAGVSAEEALENVTDPRARKILEMFKGTDTKIIGIPPGGSGTFTLGGDGSCSFERGPEPAAPTDEEIKAKLEALKEEKEEVESADKNYAPAKIKFLKDFIGKDGVEYKAGETYTFDIPSCFWCESTLEAAHWDPDCMDEAERYVRWFLQDKLFKPDSDRDLRYVFAHSDLDPDECDDSDDEDVEFWGLVAASPKRLAKEGSVFTGEDYELEVDHSKNAKLIEEHTSAGWKTDDSIIPFCLLNVNRLFDEL